MNPTVGALSANAAKIIEMTRQAVAEGAKLVVFPELTVAGYPPEDLILKDHFANDCRKQLDRLAQELPAEAHVIVGVPIAETGKKYNAAVVFHGSQIIGTYKKMLLPNYGVFDEKRLFTAGTEPLVLAIGEQKVAIHICEDSWDANGEAVASLEDQKIDLLVNLSASPYYRGKLNERIDVLAHTATKLNAQLLYCNLVGGQDELVFDGASMVFSADGACVARARQFDEDILYFQTSGDSSDPRKEPPFADLKEVYEALKLGLKDYVEKNGFRNTVVALSGGIDSALVLALAVDALGAGRVAAITMPSQFSSSGTLNDAIEMAEILGVRFHTIPIKGLYKVYKKELAPVWGGHKQPGLAEENLQARIRGNLIMALSNEFGWMVLATGNKSEMAMGYSTIYGDMCGGFAVIKDVPKILVFDLCRWRNEQDELPVIPPSIIARPPSAELKPDQKDTDSLPPYEELDPILEDYVENDLGIDALNAKGYGPQIVKRVVHAVELSEYKRRQGPPGIKITPRAFGRDRRMPITNRYRN